MISKNLFLQGIYPFEGAGLDTPVPISDELVHVVPEGVVNQTLYFRGGNTSPELGRSSWLSVGRVAAE